MAKVRKRQWKTASGEARTAWAVDFVDSTGGRQRKQFGSSREAHAFRVEIEGQLANGTHRPDAAKTTVEQIAKLYLEHVEGRARRGERFSQRHLNMVDGRIFNYIAPDVTRSAKAKGGKSRATPFTEGIGAVALSRLTPPVVDDFRDRLREAGVSVPTTRKIIGTLHAILEFAIRKNYVAANAARGVRVIGRRDEGSKKIVPPSKEALQTLMDAADPDFRLKIFFAAMTGLRAGEFHALRWHHLNLDNYQAVKVETRVDAYNEEDAPKSAAGIREVPLSSSIVKQLKEWKLRSKWSKPTDLVFPNGSGSFMRHTHMITGHFYPLFDKIEVTRFNWHALRHFAVSCWIEADMKPKTVQTFAGHSSLAMTMDLYGHLFKSDDHRAAMDTIANGFN